MWAIEQIRVSNLLVFPNAVLLPRPLAVSMNMPAGDQTKIIASVQVIIPGKVPKYGGFGSALSLIAKEEGVRALWKGLTPRLMRIMPGQAITFMTYEWVSKRLPDSITGDSASLSQPSTPTVEDSTGN